MVRLSDYLEVAITEAMIDRARVRADSEEYDLTLPDSKFRAEYNRTYYGFLAEEMFTDLTGIKLVQSYEHDAADGTEVKTISCKFRPHLDYWAVVNSPYPDRLRQQKGLRYVFTRVDIYQETGWIVGEMPCPEFWEKAIIFPKGAEIYPGVIAERCPGGKLFISELYPFRLGEK